MDLARRIGKDEVRFFEYLRLEVEDVPEFTEFVMKETGQDENDLYVNSYKEWRELALRFAGITKAEQRRAIKYRALKEIGLFDRSRVMKPKKARSSSNE
jgi:hypothetical protein